MAPFSLQLNPALSPSLSFRANENNSESQILNLPIKPQIKNSRVLILGGTGRVGGSTALALSKLSPNLRLVIGGRNREKGDDLVSRLGESSEFVQIDIENVRALESALQDPQWLSRDNIDVAHIGRDPQWQSGDDIDVPNIHRDPQWVVEHVSLTQSGIDGVEAFSLIGYISSRVACMWFKNLGNPTGHGSVIVADVDLVVHAAGPFQRAEKCTVLEAAISTKTAYMDVCDDADYSIQAKTFHEKAVAANIPAITTAGIYPGVSNVMAAELVRSAREENMGEPQKLRFSYFTAGTGGVGPTILATSFLLLGEDVVAYSKGEEVKLKPYSGKVNVDFGKGIGKKDVYLLNLPEVRSVHKILGVPTVSARFGTAPFFWNWGMLAMTLVPSEILRDRNKVQNLAELFDPVVRALDKYSGERVSMRVDLDCSNGRNTVGIFSHKKLSVSVGISTAAFALAILEGSTQPGVWFPEEPQGIAVEDRQLLLNRASQGTINFVMDQMPWMVESEPKELVFGIYL